MSQRAVAHSNAVVTEWEVPTTHTTENGAVWHTRVYEKVLLLVFVIRHGIIWSPEPFVGRTAFFDYDQWPGDESENWNGSRGKNSTD